MRLLHPPHCAQQGSSQLALSHRRQLDGSDCGLAAHHHHHPCAPQGAHAASLSALRPCCCRETTLEFMHALPPVVDRILSCFAVGIGFPENYFKEVNIFCLDAHTNLMASTSKGRSLAVSAWGTCGLAAHLARCLPQHLAPTALSRRCKSTSAIPSVHHALSPRQRKRIPTRLPLSAYYAAPAEDRCQ